MGVFWRCLKPVFPLRGLRPLGIPLRLGRTFSSADLRLRLRSELRLGHFDKLSANRTGLDG